MQNMAMLTYLSIHDGVHDLTEKLYSQTRSLSIQINGNYYNDFLAKEKGLIMLFQSAVSILNHPHLSETITASNLPKIVDIIKSSGHVMIQCLVDLHNYFTGYRVLNYNTKCFLKRMSYRVTKYHESICFFCERLLKTSDFTNPNFVLLALAINNIMFFASCISVNVEMNISYKEYKLMQNMSLNDTIGIRSKYGIMVDYDVDIPGFKVDNAVQQLSNIIKTNLASVHEEFLSKGLREKCGCAFEHLLSFISQLSRNNPGGKAFIPETEIILDYKVLKAINRLNNTEYIYDNSDFRKEMSLHFMKMALVTEDQSSSRVDVTSTVTTEELPCQDLNQVVHNSNVASEKSRDMSEVGEAIILDDDEESCISEFHSLPSSMVDMEKCSSVLEIEEVRKIDCDKSCLTCCNVNRKLSSISEIDEEVCCDASEGNDSTVMDFNRLSLTSLDIDKNIPSTSLSVSSDMNVSKVSVVNR